ncbi:hypothetical protein FOA52_014302 [Chlamydomonas sp. UWO 241]|nr:hypothetical protein FOA52_014302 [Chlamydomonas sp. UWO 241]
MLVNHYKMKSTIESYSLGGMGCANGVIALNLVHDLLTAHPNSNALFVCTEVLTPALYQGNDRHRLVTNVLFRLGATAVLLSNKPHWRDLRQSKYRLKHTVRVHTGARNDAHGAIHFSPDDRGLDGIYLGINVVHEATRALTMAMSQIGPRVLTWRQLGQAVAFYAREALTARRKKQKQHGDASGAASSPLDGSSPSSGGSSSAVTAATPAATAAATAAPAGPKQPATATVTATAALPPASPEHPTTGLATATAGSNGGADGGGGSGGAPAAMATTNEPPAPVTATDSEAASGSTAATATPAGPKRVSLIPKPPTSGFRPCFAESTAKHWLLHAGGAKILDGVGAALKLPESFLEPSRAVLHDYGNVSSSTTWYTLGFIETVRGVKAGDKVVQVGIGSGMKCGVNVLQALRDIDDIHPSWEHRVDDGWRAAVAEAAVSARATDPAGPAAVALLLLTLLVVAAAVWLGYEVAEGDAAAEVCRAPWWA